jgi:hypothetical protein
MLCPDSRRDPARDTDEARQTDEAQVPPSRRRWVRSTPGRWILGASLVAAGVSLGIASRHRHERVAESLARDLERQAAAETQPDTFHPSMTDGLPAPARRYLRRTFAPGAPLHRSVRLSMQGSIRLRPDGAALPMEAEQVLAPPHGFVWKAVAGTWRMWFRGFDRYGQGKGAMRWWLYGVLPVVSASGPDITRSAAGRLGGEAVFVPALLLPASGASWEAVDDDTARVTLPVGGEPVSSTLAVAGDGRLRSVTIRRWRSDGEKPGYDRFVVDRFGEERTIDGVTLPTRFRAGWRLGEPDAFPFFEACLDTIRFGASPTG